MTTRQDYEHRRKWIKDEILSLAGIFAFDVSAYAVMSSHFNVVLFINADQSKGWPDAEAIDRWHQLFNGTLHSQRFMVGEEHNKHALQLLANKSQSGASGSLTSVGLCACSTRKLPDYPIRKMAVPQDLGRTL